MAKPQGAGGDAFSRDLGYLEAFFDKLDAHGSSLGGASGGRLRELIAEERQRWAEIRSLLSGAPSSVAAEAPPSQPRPAAGPTATLTVGSLRSRRD